MELDMEEEVSNVSVQPMIDNKPVPNGNIVSNALSIISLKEMNDDDDPDLVVKRNSFRDLQHPNISHLNWVMESNNKEEVGYRDVSQWVDRLQNSRSN